jgi:hypothetical protein
MNAGEWNNMGTASQSRRLAGPQEALLVPKPRGATERHLALGYPPIPVVRELKPAQ